MEITRRALLAATAGLGAAMAAGGPVGAGAPGLVRRFHYSLTGDMIDREPTLLAYLRQSGVTDVYLSWWVGTPPPPDDQLDKNRKWKAQIEAAGMAAHMITIPLGHPAEGPRDPRFPVDGHWGVDANSRTFAGTSFHPPVLRDNLAAMDRFRPLGFRRYFVDDDFRLAGSPFDIGGCFCPQHKAAFLARHGYPEARWAELIDSVHSRTLTPILREWVISNCDELTDTFRKIRKATRPAELGIMVMYLGSEKAGIRLADYGDVPFRVGELMFDDAGFGPVKGKTDELFGVLFHRRFVRPEMAYSETTAYLPQNLSPANGAAKLCTSTIADVRNTMMMCMNLAEWERRAPGLMAGAIKRHAALHQKVAGHELRGPYKHYWGEHSRMAGGDWPYSLFLATGMPFEVTDRPASDGWTFLSDADARAAADGRLKSRGTEFVYRPSAARTRDGRPIADNLDDLFALRREALAGIKGVPYIEEEIPAICAWYPSARAVLVWNPQEKPVDLTLRCGADRRPVHLAPLAMELLEGVVVRG